MLNLIENGCILGYLSMQQTKAMINALLGAVLMVATGTPATPIIPKESAVIIEEPARSSQNRRDRRKSNRKKQHKR